MSAIIREIYEGEESPLLTKLKEKDRERAKKVITDFYKKQRFQKKLKSKI